MKSVIAVNPNLQSPPSFTITLESTGIFLAALVSLSILGGIGIKIISKINDFSAELKAINKDLNEYEKLLERIEAIEERFHALDKRFDIHSQDYINYKDSLLLITNNLKELIKHNRERQDEEFAKTNSEVKDLQRYLQQRGDFRIRE